MPSLSELLALPAQLLIATVGGRWQDDQMIKAPAVYELVIPTSTNLALLLVSAEALNQPLTPDIANDLI